MDTTQFEIPSLNTYFANKLPVKGSLAKIPAYVLVLNCFKSRFSGRIILENKQRIKHLYFHHGAILNIHSNLQDESFKNILLKKMLLPQAKIQKIAAKLDEIEAFRKESIFEHHEQAQYLLQLDPKRIQAIEKHVCLEKLLDLLGWFQGDYLIQENFSHTVPQIEFGVHLEVLYKNLQNFFLHALPLFEQPYQSPKIPIDVLLNKKNPLVFTSVSNILTSLSFYNASGILTLHKDNFIKKITFSKGNISKIQSNKSHESLLTTLIRWNFISPEKINYFSKYENAEFESMLTQSKMLKPNQLHQAQKILKFEQYLQIFHWKIGTYHFEGELNHYNTVNQGFESSHKESNALQDLQKTLHTLKNDVVFLIFKKNALAFKTLCKKINFHIHEIDLIDHDDLTIAQKSDLLVNKQDSARFMVWEKWSNYIKVPKKIVCVVHQKIDSNQLHQIKKICHDEHIENLGFFMLS